MTEPLPAEEQLAHIEQQIDTARAAIDSMEPVERFVANPLFDEMFNETREWIVGQLEDPSLDREVTNQLVTGLKVLKQLRDVMPTRLRTGEWGRQQLAGLLDQRRGVRDLLDRLRKPRAA